MTTTTPVLITVREALLLMGWLGPDDPLPSGTLSRRVLKLCAARGITVEQFAPGADYWISRPQLEQYIATLQPQGGAA